MSKALTEDNSTTILIVDDDNNNRVLLSDHLQSRQYNVQTASNGKEALDQIERHPPDLILLDIMMPVMDGFAVLEYVKADNQYRHIPVIVLTGFDDIEYTVRCIEMGAEDRLDKPINTVLLWARIDNALEKKRLRDQEIAYFKLIEAEQIRSNHLLHAMLPSNIVSRLKNKEQVIADNLPDVTVLFSDIVDFTRISSEMKPNEVVELLNGIFSAFDRLAQKHQLEKIKTIGDSYMVVGGLTDKHPDQAATVVRMAIDMSKALARFKSSTGQVIKARFGVSTGPAIAGVIGENKPVYDLWGTTVNLASRMETYGQPGYLQASVSTYERVKHLFTFEERHLSDVKGIGKITTYLLQL